MPPLAFVLLAGVLPLGTGDRIPVELQQAFLLRQDDQVRLRATCESFAAGRVYEIETRVDGQNFLGARQRADDHALLEGRLLTPAVDQTTRLDGRYFISDGAYTSCEMWDAAPEGDAAWDLRGAGLLPSVQYLQFEVDALFQRPLFRQIMDSGEFQAEDDGPLRRITCRLTGEQESILYRWWIDPERDGQLVRSEVETAGVVRVRAQIELHDFDGHWFPRTIHCDEWDPAAGRLVRKSRLTFTDVQLQRRDLPPLTLLDAGVDIGTNVVHVVDGEVERFDGSSSPKLWTSNGIDLVDYRTVAREFADGRPRGVRFERGLRLGRMDADIGAGGHGLTGWRLFVERFIAVYQLDAEQAQRARLLLAGVEQELLQEWRRRPPPTDELRAARAALLARELGADEHATEPDVAPDGLARLVQLRRDANGRLDEVFRERLVPKLYRVPTRTQLASADDHDFVDLWRVSRPGKGPPSSQPGYGG